MDKIRLNDVRQDEPVVAFHTADSGRRRMYAYSIIIVILLVAIGGVVGYSQWHKNGKEEMTSTQPSVHTDPKKIKVSMLGPKLDTTKAYGNKYADGKLPVGDGKYVTTAPKQGYIYACSNYAKTISADSGGASTRGPWFTNNNMQYDNTKKPHVLGSVVWQAEFTNVAQGDTRTIMTNDLPSHPTGIFPIATTDPAYSYDHNPNTIKGQTLTYALNTGPIYSSTPICMSGQVGVMLTGTPLYNGFDAGARDAGAWEVQDSCDGHPQQDGEYHYHTLSSCIKDISVHTVIGYALDGYPITGPTVAKDNVLTTSDLDECHGITSAYYVNGQSVTGYHYVMTQDFPYSISCFRSMPINAPSMQFTAPPKTGGPIRELPGGSPTGQPLH